MTKNGTALFWMFALLVFPGTALAGDWGEAWGTMVWGLPVSVPSVPVIGLIALAIALSATAAWVLRKRRAALGLPVLLVLLAVPLVVVAGTLSVPNTFVNGAVADADEVNANFDAIEVEVNDNDARITIVDGNQDVFVALVIEAQDDADAALSNAASAQATANAKQTRVSSYCLPGSSIRVIESNGTVTCEIDDNSSEIPPGAVGALEIAADAVGSSELDEAGDYTVQGLAVTGLTVLGDSPADSVAINGSVGSFTINDSQVAGGLDSMTLLSLGTDNAGESRINLYEEYPSGDYGAYLRYDGTNPDAFFIGSRHWDQNETDSIKLHLGDSTVYALGDLDVVDQVTAGGKVIGNNTGLADRFGAIGGSGAPYEDDLLFGFGSAMVHGRNISNEPPPFIQLSWTTHYAGLFEGNVKIDDASDGTPSYLSVNGDGSFAGEIYAANYPKMVAESGSAQTNLTTGYTDVVSLSITTQSAGSILVTFSGYLQTDAASGYTDVGIGTTDTAVDQFLRGASGATDATTEYFPFSVQYLYTESESGTFIYYGNAKSSVAGGDVYSPYITAVYTN